MKNFKLLSLGAVLAVVVTMFSSCLESDDYQQGGAFYFTVVDDYTTASGKSLIQDFTGMKFIPSASSVQALGGIRLDEAEPGYRHFYVDPQIPNGVTWTKATKESPYGTIAVNWELKGNQLNLQLTVPAGTTATVCIPDDAVSCKMGTKKVNIKKKTVLVKEGNHHFVFGLNKL